MSTQGYRVGIVGAPGVVGRTLLQVLEERQFPVAELRLLATERSAGRRLRAFGSEHRVETTSRERLKGLDIVFLAAGTDASRHWAPVAQQAGAVVIDKSNAFRLDPQVPLVVPEVNGEELRRHQGLIASPNCSTIQLVVALKPLYDRVGLERVVVATYQSVSGTGQEAMEELRRQVQQWLAEETIQSTVYPRQIAFNLLPHIDSFDQEGYTLEEMKLVRETRRILGAPELRISATTVRVPVFIGHAEAVLVETRTPVAVDTVRAWLREAPGVMLVDDPAAPAYPTPVEVTGSDLVYVGRLRRDLSSERGIWMWIVADNLRKGAATNAVQIAELLFRREV